MNNLKYLNASRNIYREYEDDIGLFDLDQSSSSYTRPQETSSLSCDTSKLKTKTCSLDDSKHVNLFLIDYLNKEFISLGYEAFLSQSFHAYFSNSNLSPSRDESVRLFAPSDSDQQAVSELINSNLLVANALKLVERYKINLKQYEEEKEK